LVEMNLNGVLKIENNNGTLVQIEWEEWIKNIKS
jgi:hypothetical protein